MGVLFLFTELTNASSVNNDLSLTEWSAPGPNLAKKFR